MAHVQVIQRHAHLAGAVKIEFVNGREGKIAKAVLTAISNTRRGSGEAREEESTAIQWTLWGKQAENAAEYLGKGSHVNIIGRLRNAFNASVAEVGANDIHQMAEIGFALVGNSGPLVNSKMDKILN